MDGDDGVIAVILPGKHDVYFLLLVFGEKRRNLGDDLVGHLLVVALKRKLGERFDVVAGFFQRDVAVVQRLFAFKLLEHALALRRVVPESGRADLRLQRLDLLSERVGADGIAQLGDVCFQRFQVLQRLLQFNQQNNTPYIRYYSKNHENCQAYSAPYTDSIFKKAPTAPVSRVLFTTIIYLGYMLPWTSLPPLGAAEQAYAPVCGVAPDRVYMATQSPVCR